MKRTKYDKKMWKEFMGEWQKFISKLSDLDIKILKAILKIK